jgi:hypothetical protein
MSLTREFKNFIKGSLNGALGASATSVSVNFDTNASVIPAGVSATNYMMVVVDPDGTEHAPECLKVTAVTGSANPYVLTVVRAQENTSAQGWDADRRIVAPITRDMLDSVLWDTGNLTYDHTNERLGIKDTASAWSGGGPAEAIHVRHSDPTIQLENTATNADAIISAVDADGSLVLSADQNSDVSSGTTAKVILKTGSTERLRAHNTGVTITGVLAKTSGTFDIEHPALGAPHRLRHSFVEAPQADLIYRGTEILNDFGAAEVCIDVAAGMTEGTWQALSKNPWTIVACPAGTPVEWSLDDCTLLIKGAPGAVVNWIVISERHDVDMFLGGLTDDNGNFIVEYEGD